MPERLFFSEITPIFAWYNPDKAHPPEAFLSGVPGIQAHISALEVPGEHLLFSSSVSLSRMSAPEVRKFGKQMKSTRKTSTVVPYVVSRAQLGQIAPETSPPLQTAIKTMPDFDPDAEITGLTLTIPSWTSSIKRTRSNSDLRSISLNARMNLQHALFNLQATIDEFLQAIKE